MEYNLTQPIAERKTKTVYRDGNKTITLFIDSVAIPSKIKLSSFIILNNKTFYFILYNFNKGISFKCM